MISDVLCPSKKNRMRLVRFGGTGRVILAKDAAVRRAEVGIRAAAEALGHPMFPKSAELEMRMEWDVEKREVLVEVGPIGEIPVRGRTGRRRDVINMPAVVADALEGVWYEDDSQIQRLVVTRVVRHG